MTIKYLLLALISGCCAVPKTSANTQEIPAYVAEFVSKLGIELKALDPDKPLHIALRDAVTEIGYDRVAKQAKAAVDSGTNGPYFRITNSVQDLQIAKRYPLISGYRSITLLLMKDESGSLVSAVVIFGN